MKADFPILIAESATWNPSRSNQNFNLTDAKKKSNTLLKILANKISPNKKSKFCFREDRVKEFCFLSNYTYCIVCLFYVWVFITKVLDVWKIIIFIHCVSIQSIWSSMFVHTHQFGPFCPNSFKVTFVWCGTHVASPKPWRRWIIKQLNFRKWF